MKRYIRANAKYSSDEVWSAIPNRYLPYIEDIEVYPQYSIYRNKEIITYNVIFKPEVWEDDKEPVVGLFHIEDINSLVKSIQEYLDPII